jgi:hypothetical protein
MILEVGFVHRASLNPSLSIHARACHPLNLAPHEPDGWCRRLLNGQRGQKWRGVGQTNMLFGQQLVSPGAACQAGL